MHDDAVKNDSTNSKINKNINTHDLFPRVTQLHAL